MAQARVQPRHSPSWGGLGLGSALCGGVLRQGGGAMDETSANDMQGTPPLALPPGCSTEGVAPGNVSSQLRPCFRERLLVFATEFEDLEAELRQLKNEVSPACPIPDADPCFGSSDTSSMQKQPPPALASGNCPAIVLGSCCGPPSSTQPGMSGCARIQRLPPPELPMPRAFCFRERLNECAAEYELLEEENRFLARELSRLADSSTRSPTGLSARDSRPSPDLEPKMSKAPEEQSTIEDSGSLACLSARDSQPSRSPEPKVTSVPEDQVIIEEPIEQFESPPTDSLLALSNDAKALEPAKAKKVCIDESGPEVREMVEESPDAQSASSQQSKSKGKKGNDAEEQEDMCPMDSKASMEPSSISRPRKVLAVFLDTTAYKLVMTVSVVFALFAGGLWVIMDIPDDPGNAVLDALFVIVGIFFALEIVFNLIVTPKDYAMSFFFWMDILGTASMAFEISFLFGSGGKIKEGSQNVDAVIMRTARAAKVGARVGRLFKIMKCLSLVLRRQQRKGRKALTANDEMEAKVISQRLMFSLSTRVSCIVILLALFIPFTAIGQYPEADLSLRNWSLILEDEYKRAVDEVLADPFATTSSTFKIAVIKLIEFYEDVNYGPFEIDGYDEHITIDGRAIWIPGKALLNDDAPVRAQNILRQSVEDCLVPRQGCNQEVGTTASIYFNFKLPNGMEVIGDTVLIIVLIGVMAAAAFDLSRVINALLVQPLERMMGMLHKYATNILEQVMQADSKTEEDSEAEDDYFRGGPRAETDLLEDLMRKLARLAQISTHMHTAKDLEGMDNESRGVVMEMMHMTTSAAPKNRFAGPAVADRPAALTEYVGNLPCAEEFADSWYLDMLDFETPQLAQVVLHMFFDSRIGIITGRTFVAPTTFKRFHETVKDSYNDLPYHCYAHACDVLHTVWRTLGLVQSEKWLAGIEQYSLLIAALCHDLGHMGRTNPFLVETRHELALLYNDNSPLENMHCAKLFEICSRPDLDVFGMADDDDRKAARKVCISSILHTDNIHHVDMVRQISQIYEVNSDLCDAAAAGDVSRYLGDVLLKDANTWLQLFLHLADVSNPLKPFKLCHLWAWRVLEEFFVQGDEEKDLGLPVGMLNDRDKVNRPGSQHGFINFMVAPLVTSTVKIFPTLHSLTTQMAINLEQWRDLWVQDAKPSPEEIQKRDDEVAKVRESAEQLVARCSVSPDSFVSVGRGRASRMSRRG